MNTRSLLASLVAAVALYAGPSLAQQHSMSSMGGGAAGIAEGTVKNGVRTVQVAVTDEGFVPSKVKAMKGEKVRLVVTRKTDHTCAKEIVIKDAGIHQALPLDRAVTVEFTPKKSGEIRYACGMDMSSGVVLVP